MNNVFEKYKDAHKGKRVFLVANGPSLNDTNLDLLKDEITFAMNRISLKYEETSWRPTYYLFSSTNVMPSKPWHQAWRSSVRKAMSVDETTCFVANQFKGCIDPSNEFEKTNWFYSMTEVKPDLDGNIHPSCFSTDVVERIDKTGTTMNLALQLCYYMGFSEIILVGADLGWTHDTGTKNDPNHFVKDYVAEIVRPEKTNNQMRNVHSLAAAYFERDKPETVFYNASSKTVLDVYPIIDFESYVSEGVVKVLEEKREEAKKFWTREPQYGYHK
tara:strand:+ start:918 stop:1736 length:819 start_codon:yes stop_codon:yes gene_type:complete